MASITEADLGQVQDHSGKKFQMVEYTIASENLKGPTQILKLILAK